MPCLFANTMNMSGSLLANTQASVHRLLQEQSTRFENVSDGAKDLYVWVWPILIATTLYLPICWMLKAYYKDRKPFPYRMPVVLWNVALSVLSAAGSLTILICHPSLVFHKADPRDRWDPISDIGVHPAAAFVVRVFCITKFVEYGDTFWLCVKKRPTIFLHLYHHITVSLFCLHSVLLDIDYGHFFAFVNLNIHAVMYGYYAAAIVFKGNKFLNSMRPFITLGQLTQMFVGTAICSYEIVSSYVTPGLRINAFLGFVMYVSYAYLFGDFFVKNYKTNLNSLDTLFALTPACFLPLLCFGLGWSEMLFAPWSTTAAAITVAVVVRLLGYDVMSCLSPIQYSGFESIDTVKCSGIRCMVKKQGIEDTYTRMFTVIARYSALPCCAIAVDSYLTSYITLRSLPIIFTTWCVHSYIGGAWSYAGCPKKTETVEKGPVNKVKIAENLPEDEIVCNKEREDTAEHQDCGVRRRTVPVVTSSM